jgi:hypothetical protein
MKLHEILIGMVLMGIISSGLILFISGGVSVYSVTDYDNSTLESFNKINELQADVEVFSADQTSVDEKDYSDILGGLFSSAYTAAKILGNSADILGSIISSGIDNIPIGAGFKAVLKNGLGLIALIAISVGILLAFITKSERT